MSQEFLGVSNTFLEWLPNSSWEVPRGLPIGVFRWFLNSLQVISREFLRTSWCGSWRAFCGGSWAVLGQLLRCVPLIWPPAGFRFCPQAGYMGPDSSVLSQDRQPEYPSCSQPLATVASLRDTRPLVIISSL